MKHLLITSMIALGVSCGAAMAQSESAQSGDTNCATGQADCQKGGKSGEQVQGKMKSETNQNAQGKAGATTEQNAQDNTKLKKDQQAQGKSDTKMKTDEQAQDKAGMSTGQSAQGKTKMKTDDQAQGKAGTSTEQSAQGKTKMKTDDQAQGKAGVKTEQNAQGNANVETDQNKTASISNVTVEQKTQVTQIIHETKVEPVKSVDFDLSVGIEVPRHKIHLHRLPARIVRIVPAYESYEYFVLADGRIVIVDPDSYKIVLILT